MNVRFLKDIGLLDTEGRGAYVPTPMAIQFVNARTISDDRARPILRKTLEDTWFFDAARHALVSKPTMGESELLDELAFAAMTDRTKKERALRILIEYLVFSGLVQRDDHGLSLTAGLHEESSPAPAPVRPQDSSASITGSVPSRPRQEAAVPEQRDGWHTIQTEDFFLRLRSNLDALEDLKDYLDVLRRKVERSSRDASSKSSDVSSHNEASASSQAHS